MKPIIQIVWFSFLLTIYEHHTEQFARTYDPPHNWYYTYNSDTYELHRGIMELWRNGYVQKARRTTPAK
jgi:hypothetical protein